MTFDEALKIKLPTVSRPVRLWQYYSGNAKQRRKAARRYVIELAKKSKKGTL